MALDGRRIVKPLRKLHKILGHPSAQMSPERVHELRTRCYRVQSTLRAFGFAEERRGVELVESLERFRKRAGKVRDADVLTSLAATLRDRGESEALLQLIEELGVRRDRFADRLERTISHDRRQSRAELKRFRKRIEKQLATSETSEAEAWSTSATARSIELAKKIAGWPKLREDNLHPFRLTVKELRAVTQLSSEPDLEFLDALREVKDAVGEWHDWSELAALAAKVLDGKNKKMLSNEIDPIREDRLQNALIMSARLRQRYFDSGKSPRRGHDANRHEIQGAALSAAARLAA
jgi:CHAD domain-containing protein